MHRSTNSQGFIHYGTIVIGVAIIVISLVFVLVKDHQNETRYTLIKAAADTTAKSQTDATAQSQPALPASNPSSAAASQSGSSPTTTNTTSAPASSPSAPAPNPTPVATPLSTLISLITNLDKGSQANITASAVTVPGPVNDATARPLVFTLSGQVYFAYRQGTAPDFSTSADETANTMAIVKVSGSIPSLVQAHLNKAGTLVDPNSMGNLVGYSQGGDVVRQ
jgi:hypothetical protein